MKTEEMKYIIAENEYGLEFPILFSPDIQHDQIFSGKKVSAGYCCLRIAEGNEYISYDCYGESISLQMKSRKEIDEEILNKNFLKKEY